MKTDTVTPDPDECLKKVVTILPPTDPQCYCTNPRNFSVPDFQCSVCYKWFHYECIAFNIGKSLPFLTAYHFMCKKCNSAGEEVYSRKQANFAVMCQTALANLMWRNSGRLYFSEEKELIPFLEECWEELTTQPRKSNNSWYPNIHKTLTSSDAFKTVEHGTDLLVCLSNTDIGKMGPSYDRFRALTSQLRTNITKLGVPNVQSNAGLGDSGETMDQDGDEIGWRKRKSPASAQQGRAGAQQSNTGGSTNYSSSNFNAGSNVADSGGADFPIRITGGRGNGAAGAGGSGSAGGSLVRSTRRAGGSSGLCGGAAAALSSGPIGGLDEGRAKLNALGFPVDFPFNKEGYRYILVEPDRHAAGRQLWDESEYTAGKPIPGLFYRVYISPHIVLSTNDRAHHLKLHESQLQLTGEKGYCMGRATHGVHTGTWYFEATIIDQPEGSASRIGWSQSLGNLQAPCGYDKFGYSWRSRLGTVFHDARGKHFAAEGYKKDDVIGCLIHLPTNGGVEALVSSINQAQPEPSRDRPLPMDTGSPQTLDSDVHMKIVYSPSSQKPVKRSSRLVVNQLPETFKDRPLIKFRNSYYFEEKEEPSKAEKTLSPLPGSKIVFYRNGEYVGTAFKDIYAGIYFPSISIYRSATVAVNFGPKFRHPPHERDHIDWQPMCDRVTTAAVEQTMADMLYLLDKEGLVERMIKTYATGS